MQGALKTFVGEETKRENPEEPHSPLQQRHDWPDPNIRPWSAFGMQTKRRSSVTWNDFDRLLVAWSNSQFGVGSAGSFWV